MMNACQNLILRELKEILSLRFEEDLKDVILFGSQLSDTAQQDSDYDILIILKKNIDWKIEREISDLCFEIELKHGVLFDTHILSEADLHTLRGKQPIFVNALSHGIHA